MAKLSLWMSWAQRQLRILEILNFEQLQWKTKQTILKTSNLAKECFLELHSCLPRCGCSHHQIVNPCGL